MLGKISDKISLVNLSWIFILTKVIRTYREEKNTDDEFLWGNAQQETGR